MIYYFLVGFLIGFVLGSANAIISLLKGDIKIEFVRSDRTTSLAYSRPNNLDSFKQD